MYLIKQIPILITGHHSGCGITEDVSQWMDSIQNSAIDDEIVVKSLPTPERLEKHKQNPFNLNNPNELNDDFKYPHEKYSREANWPPASDNYRYDSGSQSDDEWHAEAHKRVRRAPRPKEENKNTCSLYIQTDPLIWRHIREGIADVSSANTYFYFGFYCITCMLFVSMV